MEWLLLFFICATVVRSDGITEISADGRLWHYIPVSKSAHWVFPSIVSSDVEVSAGCVLFRRGKNDSLVIKLDPLSVWREALDISALVRCELGCDARIEEIALDGRCEVIEPPGCVRFRPKFRRIRLCLKTGEFITDHQIDDIGDAFDLERIHQDLPYNITIGC